MSVQVSDGGCAGAPKAIVHLSFEPFGDGILYQVELQSPGIFATSLGVKMQTLAQANQLRQVGHDRQCK